MSVIRHVTSQRRSADVAGAGPPPRVTASLADAGGTVVTTVSRHDEADTPGGAPLAVVRVRGEIDQDTVALLDTILTDVIDHNGRVCCDLSEVDFLSAAGLNAMLAAHRHAGAAGCSFHLRGAHGITRRVLQITGLDQLLLRTD